MKIKDRENKKFTIYKYTLKGTDRCYIGQTCMSVKQRAGSSGHRYKSCTKFYYAIQKYGWENFELEILKDNLSLDEANQLEQEYILKYNSINNGFNLVHGGRNHLWTEEERKKMSERIKGEKIQIGGNLDQSRQKEKLVKPIG